MVKVFKLLHTVYFKCTHVIHYALYIDFKIFKMAFPLLKVTNSLKTHNFFQIHMCQIILKTIYHFRTAQHKL